MFMTNQGDIYYDKIISKDEKDSTLAASCVKDSETSDIILKLVNAGTENKKMSISLAGFENLIHETEIIVLSGNADAENTFENPNNVVPMKSNYNIKTNFEYEASAMSLAVIRIKQSNK
jgi:alpha-L-arabinofuranosidase